MSAKRVSIGCAVVGLVVSLVVGAPAAAAPIESASRMRVGLNLIPMPVGTFKASLGGFSGSGDLEFAFGIAPFFDYLLSPNFFVGFGPTYTFNVKPKDASGSSGTELDLLLRVGAGAPISDKVQLFAYLTPGYSVIMPPSGNDPKGFVLGLHGGAMYSATPTLFLNGDLGYQIGFQQLTIAGNVGATRVDVTGDAKFSYFQIVLGGGIRL